MIDDFQQFKDTYLTECFELLEEMEEKLLSLDADSADREELNAIFRCAHSIKGGAGAFGFTAIANFTHILEALLDKMRDGKIHASKQVVDTLLKSRDALFQMVCAARDGTVLASDYGSALLSELQAFTPDTAMPVASTATETLSTEAATSATWQIVFKPRPTLIAHGNEPLLLLRELASTGNCKLAAHTETIPPLQGFDAEQTYLWWEAVIETTKPQAALREVFEFVEDECELTITALPSAGMAGGDSGDEREEAAKSGSKASGSVASIRVDIDKVDRLINMVGEVVITQAFLSSQVRSLPPGAFTDLMRGVEEMMHHTRELQEAVMAIRMQPVKSIFSRMPRLVRDLSSQLGKQIELEMEGEATEVDKTIIEQLSDPLTHMIRNAVDHGIEMPDVRAAAGKPRKGIIRLSAEHRSGRIMIEIADNGGGINRERVLRKAREKGLVSADVTPGDEEIDRLIFAPGFSTAEVVSNVSGRGVGMDVVKRNIEGLGGNVQVLNRPGEGSSFTISLPLTLAILDGMIIRVGSEYYIIPIGSIIETLRPRAGDVKSIADGSAVLNVRGEFIPVIYLHRMFKVNNAITEASSGLVVLVETGSDQLGIVVDELVGQQQVVIKSLEDNSDPIEGISGATILGDGKVSLILDVTQLYRMNRMHSAASMEARNAA